MRKFLRIFTSLGRPVLWLLVAAMSALAVMLILAAFSVIRLPQLKRWGF